jgi:asparagine synthase (glutamine-hydrolysing)
VLSGVGGDELCGGYRSFTEIPRRVRALRWPARIPLAGRLLRRALDPLLERQSRFGPKAAGLLEHGGSWAGAWLLQRGVVPPWALADVLGPEAAAEGLRRLRWQSALRASLDPDPGSDFARVAALEAGHYLRDQLLRDADWASMAHGVELRTPLVDAVLLRDAGPAFAAIGARAGKAVLAEVPDPPLPAAVLARPKTGFVTPVAQWLAQAGARAVGARDGGAGSRALVGWMLARNGVHA